MGKTEKKRPHPLHIIERAKAMGIRDVLVSFSAGKDSLAVADLCFEHFNRVQLFFMYVVPDLSFQEIYLRYIENRYNTKIDRIPHWQMGSIYRGSGSRHATKQATTMPAVKIRDVDHAMRKKHGLLWVASGETTGESLQRTAMIKSCDGVCTARGHIYAIGYWRKKDVEGYLSAKDIMLPPEYSITYDNRSYGGLRMELIVPIHDNFPEDYAKIRRVFPLIDAQVSRWRAQQRIDSEAAADG